MTRAAGHHLSGWPAAAVLSLAVAQAQAATDPQTETADFREVREHLIEPEPMVERPWADLTREAGSPSWTFLLTVDERGNVTGAAMRWGAEELRDEARRVAHSIRFKPFVRGGRPVPMQVEFTVASHRIDYLGPSDRTFPADPDPATTIIVLARSSCYGTCPAYRVELHGNGEVHYQGDYDVLVRGKHRWQVDPATLSPLLELLRRADYFALKGYYAYDVSDIPTYTTRVSIGEQHKFVLDYGGSGMGQAIASVNMGGEDPGMPRIVTEIERAIDQVSGVTAFVRGDDSTLQRLRDAQWNFRSQDAGHALRELLSDCNTDLAREFIRAGAPVNVAGEGMDAGAPISFAARCADFDFVRLLESKGALDRRADALDFLYSSVWKGQPGMVAIALKHLRNVNLKNSEGVPLLSEAAGAYVDNEGPGAASADPAKVVEMLIDAGADPNARDEDGKTPLFEAEEAATAEVLLRKGANLKARDREGRTALFEGFNDESKPVLLKAGADVHARDKAGRTALFDQQYAAGIKLLLDAGAKIDAVDSSGHTAIEAMTSPEAFAALLAAGAGLPTDPVRLDAMIATATDRGWTDVVSRLRAAAAAK